MSDDSVFEEAYVAHVCGDEHVEVFSCQRVLVIVFADQIPFVPDICGFGPRRSFQFSFGVLVWWYIFAADAKTDGSAASRCSVRGTCVFGNGLDGSGDT